MQVKTKCTTEEGKKLSSIIHNHEFFLLRVSQLIKTRVNDILNDYLSIF